MISLENRFTYTLLYGALVGIVTWSGLIAEKLFTVVITFLRHEQAITCCCVHAPYYTVGLFTITQSLTYM